MKKKYIRLIFLLYLIALARIIVFKYPIDTLREIALGWSDEVFWEGIGNANFELFRTINLYTKYWHMRGINSFGNLIGNILIFVPMGFLLPQISDFKKNFFVCIICSLVVILGIEYFQLYTAFGVFDVDDILLNLTGAIIGYMCYIVLRAMDSRKNRSGE